ncbi:MAG TPA: hypothetical protein VM784_13865 [Actinomycetota bacterium]|nr:hypothetical protein [Actinomycetota bacterium]
MRQRRVLGVSTAAAAIVLAAVSVSWACVTVEGTATIKKVVHKGEVSCSGDGQCAAPGDIVKVSGAEAAPNTRFFLHFRNYERTSATYYHFVLTGSHCLGNAVEDDVRISRRASMSDAEGNIAVTNGIIPRAAKSSSEYGGLLGPALLCFVDTTENIVTAGDTLTII